MDDGIGRVPLARKATIMKTISFTLPRIDYASAQVDGRTASSERLSRAQAVCDDHAEQRAGNLKPVFVQTADAFDVVGWVRSKPSALAAAKRSGWLNDAHTDYVAINVVDGDGEPGFLVDRS